MYRRGYLATTTVTGVTLAGCLGHGTETVDTAIELWFRDTLG